MFIDEIDHAITAHGEWKQKLHKAIDTGICESTPERVKMDYNCAFGKWLHERIEPEYKSSAMYPEIVDLHAQFHKEAGMILELALNGNKEKANQLMAIGGNFSSLSGMLVAKMKIWKAALSK